MNKILHLPGRLGVIGDPVSHSLSPLIHRTALELNGIHPIYDTFHVRRDELRDFFYRVREGEFEGLNVTLPHKQAVIEYLDQLSDVASVLRAVNTIQVIRTDGIHLIGHNTDVYGFSKPLLDEEIDLEGSECVVWGAGGATRAVIYALTHTFKVGVIALIARNPGKAEQLKSDLDLDPAMVRIIDWSETRNVKSAEHSARLLVNTTPVGMTPATDHSPCSDPETLHQGQIVYDIVYNPTDTRLLMEARARGARTIGGLEMLIGQASESFRLWTGTDMRVDSVRKTLAAEIESNRFLSNRFSTDR